MPPDLPPVPAEPAVAASWPTDPPENSPFTGTGLLLLRNDAAYRAHLMLAGRGGTGLAADPVVDLARRASIDMPATLRKALARSAGVTASTLGQQAEAYRMGGAEGVHLLNEPPWSPPPDELAAAVDVVGSLHLGVDPVIRSNTITFGETRYKLCHSERWLRLVKRAGRWSIDSAPADSIEGVMARG